MPLRLACDTVGVATLRPYGVAAMHPQNLQTVVRCRGEAVARPYGGNAFCVLRPGNREPLPKIRDVPIVGATDAVAHAYARQPQRVVPGFGLNIRIGLPFRAV